ncbi:transglycosylase domain-containing protein [Streptomyces sp. NPDC020681]|uniref:transglycosylase domain-containing protein n=1 Tax=Streptomyces sp. NPDC020681 TaxID=3365083 RepID=UPI0037911EA3
MRTRWSPGRTAERQQASKVGEAGASREARAAADGATTPRRHRRKRKRSRIRRCFTWKKALVAVFTVCALLAGGFTYLYITIDIPQANALAKAQSNVYLYSDGSRLARTGEINRETVPLSRVPKDVRYAFVAAENKDFYNDSGVSLSGTARGIASTLTGQGTQGGSTITQQYVKNYYLSQEQTVSRKVKELVISLKVDQRNSKDDILAGYLNSSYYGRLAYGIQAAARAYYHREVEELSVEQGAYLAALLQAPSQYDWAIAGPKGKKLVVQRWNYVLDNMVKQDWLDKDKRQTMKFPAPVAPTPAAGLSGQAGYLVDAARRELMASGVSEQELAGGGWRITLTIDPDRQRALEEAVKVGLAAGAESKQADAAADGKNRQAGAVSLDPRNGRIVALYGGRDYMRQYISNATRSDYQAGPAFEPVAIAASTDAKSDGSQPADDEHIKETANALGMDLDKSDFAAPQAVKLGLMGASPMELASVYASFQHDGKKVTPSIVKSAERGGERTQLREAVGGRAISSLAAESVNSFMRSDGARRDKAGPLWVPDGRHGVTVKSGHTDDRKAEWFIGSTEELLTSIGLFGEDATTHKQVTLKGIGEGWAATIWTNYSQQALGGDAPWPVNTATPTAQPPEETAGSGQ